MNVLHAQSQMKLLKQWCYRMQKHDCLNSGGITCPVDQLSKPVGGKRRKKCLPVLQTNILEPGNILGRWFDSTIKTANETKTIFSVTWFYCFRFSLIFERRVTTKIDSISVRYSFIALTRNLRLLLVLVRNRIPYCRRKCNWEHNESLIHQW